MASIGMLRKFGDLIRDLIHFPPMPLLIISTRFADGRRHITLNHPQYRKATRPTNTVRCLLTNGGPHETWALHRKHVDRMIAAGAVPVPPPTTPAQVLALQLEEFEESRATWHKVPYSWSDAFHDAFKICRREFLAD